MLAHAALDVVAGAGRRAVTAVFPSTSSLSVYGYSLIFEYAPLETHHASRYTPMRDALRFKFHETRLLGRTGGFAESVLLVRCLRASKTRATPATFGTS